jgi:hypothetical protein
MDGVKLKNIIVILCCLLFGCSVRIEDKSRAVHPVNAGGKNIVEVTDPEHSIGPARSVCINKLSYPLWCDPDTEIKKFNMEIIGSIVKKDKNYKDTNLTVNCLSGGELPVNCTPDRISGSDMDMSEDVFISLVENSSNDNAILALFFEKTGPVFFQFYYSLYNSLCLNTSSHCCMTGLGGRGIFYLSLPAGASESIVRDYIEAIKKSFDNETLSSSFNTFMCNFIDRCSYNDWYYSSLAQGLSTPENYFAGDRWLVSGIGKELNGIKISKIGYKLISHEKIDPKTVEKIRLVLKTALTQDGTGTYKSPR